MKAAYLARSKAGVDIIYGERPTPRPRPGEALVRVRACALNRLDHGLLTAKYPVELPHISGSDVAGEVVEINGPSRFKTGQAVVINPALDCKTCMLCKAGKTCETVKILGYNIPGGFAEYVTVPAEQLFPKPGKLTFTQAAAFPLTFLTAWHMLATRARLTAGETVFIWGASGGLGVAAVIIAKHLGAQVIAAAGNPSDAAKLKALGADDTADYTQNDLVDNMKRRHNGMDVVFESVGAKTWDRTMAMLRPLGRVVIAGTTSGDQTQLDLSNLYFNQFTVLGSRMGNAAEFAEVAQLVSAGKLAPVIDSTFGLSDFRQAINRLADSRQFGKIVVEVGV